MFSKEKTINMILDNYATHHSILLKNVAEILNINLIYLPKYSPDLNPIEDVWRIIKRHIYNSFIVNEEHIKNEFEEKFYQEVYKESYFEEWVDEYIYAKS